jgi:HEAT repeat protein
MSTDIPNMLRHLDLSGVAITAEIGADGGLRPVGGLWQKLGDGTIDLAKRGLLHTVIVAKGQDEVPPEYLREDAETFRVIEASTVDDAIRQLNQSTLPRRDVRSHEHQACQSLELLSGAKVPIESHYQMLSLLKEIEREELPREDRSPAEMREDEPDTLPGVELRRWEEEMQQKQATYKPHALDEVFSNFRQVVKDAEGDVPRFILLGPPGSGKTTLAQYLAWACTLPSPESDEHNEILAALRCVLSNRVPARVRLREWEAWAVKPVSPESSLPEYLAEHLSDLRNAPSAEEWRRWLHRGEVLLLLDGLDEIDGKTPFINALKKALTLFKACPTVITCRTVSFETHKALESALPVFTLTGLSDEQRDALIEAYPAENRDRYDPQVLIAQLNRTPQMHPLAANPLLLSIICFVVDDPFGVSLPATRSELYDKVVQRLLSREDRVEVNFPLGGEPALDDKRAVLELTALDLFGKGERQLTVSERELGRALRKSLQALGYGNAVAPWANALRIDFTQNSGILRGNARQGYFFLHLTVQEFLAAAALARLVNEDEREWDAEIQLGRRTWTVRELVDKKAWDPRWLEVIVLLAGQLDGPAPLLEMLSDEQKDDLFRHKLGLAAYCLPEISPAIRSQFSGTVNQITTSTLQLWYGRQDETTGVAGKELTRALPALAQVNGEFRDNPLLVQLSKQVRQRWGQWPTDAEALRLMGTVAVQRSDIIATLVEIARHGKYDKDRTAAARVLGAMGAMAVNHAEVIPTLVQLAQHDADQAVRSVATEGLRLMGKMAASHPDVITTLVEMVRHDQRVRDVAAEALGAMGEMAAGHPDVIPTLVEIVQHQKSSYDCEELVAALGMLWDVASPPPDVISMLVSAANHGSGGAVRALGAIGKMAAQHPEVIPMLIEIVRCNEDLNGDAVEALGTLGEPAAQHPNVIPTLVETVQHNSRSPDDYLCSRTSRALGKLGHTAVQHPDVIPTLVNALNDGCSGAAWALGAMGEAAAQHPDIVPALVNALARYVEEASWALGAIGKTAAQHPDVIPELVMTVQPELYKKIKEEALEIEAMAVKHPYADFTLRRIELAQYEEFSYVRKEAVEALGTLGEKAAQHPDVIPMLVEMVRRYDYKCLVADDIRLIHAMAARALGAMGKVVTQHPDVIPALVEALDDNDANVAFEATEALERLMAQGVRIFQRNGTWKARSVAELSQ